MSESTWHRQNSTPSRDCMLAKDIYKKYDDASKIIPKIKEGIRGFLLVEPAVRLNIDSPKSNSEQAILSIPFESDQEMILDNFAGLIYKNLSGYYLSADPQSYYSDLSSNILDGKSSSLLHREMENILSHFHSRPDIAGQLLNDVKIIQQSEIPSPGKTYLSKVLKQGLDIHLGYRIVLLGEKVNGTRIFLPIEVETDTVDLIYFNIEKILNQNFVTYDETSSRFIKVTENLIFKELESILKRVKEKQNTRKKILNNLQFEIIFNELNEDQKLLAGDKFYDLLNKTQDKKVRLHSDQSAQLYASTLSQINPNCLEFSPKTSIKVKNTTSIKKAKPTPVAPPAKNEVKVPTPPEAVVKVPSSEKDKTDTVEKVPTP